MSKTVFVGLSGGVDSATSAALLKEQGYTVVGAFIKIWQPEFIECTWAKDRLDAMRVAVSLGIPFEEIDLSEEYKEQVVKEMIEAYTSGETPNPDVSCNTSIKFGAFAAWAKQRGADAVATGHYARVGESGTGQQLLRGVDTSKDQSYFLHQLTSKQLDSIMFPIGSMRKVDVRAKATAIGLPVSSKSDSQGLCFVGDVSMRDFLKRYISVKRGNVLAMDGSVIGSHDGAALYTVGQRHGFIIHSNMATRPHYITNINVIQNTITVSSNRIDAETSTVRIRNTHWIAGNPPIETQMLAQFRYRESAVTVQLQSIGDDEILTLGEPRVTSPGQSVVFYQNERCLGGAIIANNRSSESGV